MDFLNIVMEMCMDGFLYSPRIRFQALRIMLITVIEPLE